MSRQSWSGSDNAFSVPGRASQPTLSEPQFVIPSQSNSVSIQQNRTRSSSKRGHSEVADDGEERARSKKCKTEESPGEDVNLTVVYPDTVLGFKCSGIVFTGSSMRGRLPVVYGVKDEKNNRLVVKTSWQDVTRIPDQDAVMNRLKERESHPNVVAPLKHEVEKIMKNGQMYRTLGTLRGFLVDDIARLGIEDRVFTKAVFHLKRPVKYFWGVHDFVRGLRCALLGHEYLTSIGILHRDISENNIVLGLRPEGERGYLIDLDMAILRDAEKPTQPPTATEPVESESLICATPIQEISTPVALDMKKTTRALRTGTFPYISYNILMGGEHTQFDDVESFLYVLLLFFFSYAGPLPVPELRQADETEFVHSVGSGRLSHMRNWPKKYADWADGRAEHVGRFKHSTITDPNGAKSIIQSPEFVECLKNNWPKELHDPITVVIRSAFTLFRNNAPHAAAKVARTEVSHAKFIRLLDEWLAMYSHLEDTFSNCPFK